MGTGRKAINNAATWQDEGPVRCGDVRDAILDDAMGGLKLAKVAE